MMIGVGQHIVKRLSNALAPHSGNPKWWATQWLAPTARPFPGVAGGRPSGSPLLRGHFPVVQVGDPVARPYCAAISRCCSASWISKMEPAFCGLGSGMMTGTAATRGRIVGSPRTMESQ